MKKDMTEVKEKGWEIPILEESGNYKRKTLGR